MVDFAEIAKGLLTLEINTIQKDGMSGQKMPTAPNALVDLVENYWDYLCQRASRFGSSGQPLSGWRQTMSLNIPFGHAPFPAPLDYPTDVVRQKADHIPDFLVSSPEAVNGDVLAQLRDVAVWIVEMQSRITAVAQSGEQFSTLAQTLKSDRASIVAVANLVQPEERSILYRIRRNCDQMKALGVLGQGLVTRGGPETGYTPAELVQIRKAWDLGTEVILMQTVIQLDGDVVQRFEPGVDKASRATLHALHASAVDLSFRYWKALVDTVAGFASETVSVLVKR